MKLDPIAYERFMAKVSKDACGCWIWTGSKVKSGYGKVKVNQKMFLAHRLSYMAHKGDIKSGLFICHSCDNPLCVNPDHLWAGSQIENVRDAKKKGRANYSGVIGENNSKAKLTENDIFEIRNSNLTNTELSKKFNVTQPTISNIRSKKTWKHI